MSHIFRRPSAGTATLTRLTHAFLSDAVILIAATGVAAILGCGGGGSSARTTPPPAASFTLSASPTSVSLTAGAGSQTVAFTANAANGFTGSVAVAFTGLPSGVTASPSTLTLQPGAAQSITLSASAAAAAGAFTVTATGTSGTLSSTATVSVVVAVPPPAPDFSLSLTPASLSIQAGAAGVSTSVLAAPVNGFTGTVAVALSGLPTGVTATPATLSLTPGAAQSITLTAGSSAVAASATVIFTATSGSLSHTAALALTVTAATAVGTDVVTYHDDNARDGLNASETILTPANVNAAGFGLLRTLPVDGVVDAEPLYLSSLSIGGAAHNVLYVATEHDSVYAFDADTGAQLWKVSALGTGETTSDNHGCNQITPEIGITSTPVIDRKQGTNGTIFVVAMSKDSGGAYHQRLHALDLTTGAEESGSPSEIAASYPGTGDNSSNGSVVFDPGQYAERAGLLLVNGTVYLAWTSHCDIRPYTGWVMAYSESTLKQTAVIDLTPNGNDGSIWMSGAGMAADSSGNIFFLDANGTLDATFNAQGFPAQGDFGNGIIKLSTANNALTVADFWEPYNTAAESETDTDLGSGGALLLPDLTDSAGAVHHLLVGGGKDGNIYVANRDNLGKFNPAGNGNLVQQLTAMLPHGAWSMPAYFNNTVYYGGVNDTLKAFPIANALLSTAPSSVSATTFAYPGTTPSISANGVTNGIVWSLECGTSSPAVLHAYDATNLAKELYNSTQAPNNRDSFGNGDKFVTPVIVNGKVYVPTPSGVAVFGLLPAQ